eukprot:6212850-Pleurochrysis_carterae.AAC.8
MQNLINSHYANSVLTNRQEEFQQPAAAGRSESLLFAGEVLSVCEPTCSARREEKESKEVVGSSGWGGRSVARPRGTGRAAAPETGAGPSCCRWR